MANTSINVAITANGTQAVKQINQVQNKVNELKTTKLGNILQNAIPMGALTAGLAVLGGGVANAVKSVTTLSDRFTGLKARIDLMNDGLQTNEELLKKIHSAANKSRGSYLEMADSVSKLGTLAGSAFKSNQEMIDFVEQLNKQFKISGASMQESTAAMYQLTQAMASGKLQGDEFRSILENAPMLAQAIAKEMGEPVGKLRELSSQGLITSDVIKNALINSAEETNAKFNQIPMTFSDAMTLLQNNALQAFEPVFSMLSSLTQTEAFAGFVSGATNAFKVLGSVALSVGQLLKVVFSGVGQIIKTVWQISKNLFEVFKAGYQVIVPALITWIALQKQDLIITTARRVGMLALKTVISGLVVAQTAYTVAVRASYMAQTIYNTVVRTGATLLAGYRAVTIASVASMGVLRGATLLLAGGFNVLKVAILSNPIAWLVGILAVLATAFVGPTIAAKGFAQTLSDVWKSIAHTAAWGVNKVIGLINKLIDAFNFLGNKMKSVLNIDFTKIDRISELDPKDVEEFATRVEDSAGRIKNAITDTTSMAMGGGDLAGDVGSAGSAGAKQTPFKDLKAEAERISKAIEDEYSNMFATKVELAERWYNTELAELEKSKESNENYERDKARLAEMYAQKRIDALLDEAKKAREIQNSIRDLRLDVDANTLNLQTDKIEAYFNQLVIENEKAINEIQDKWQGLSDTYASLTANEKDIFLKALDDKKIGYELDGNNRISFTKAMHDELLALEQEYQGKIAEARYQGTAIKQEIDRAMRQGSFEMLQEALTEENQAILNNYALRSEMMKEYQDAVLQSHFDTNKLIFDTFNQGINELQNGLSGIIQGTMTVGQAFQKMGQTMLKVLADQVAQYIASKLKVSMFGNMLEKKQAAASTATAMAQLPAWQSLALAKSMATFGASAETGALVYKANMGLAFLANGGLTTGATLAMIGEGKYQEAVLPLSENTYSQLAKGINEQGGGNSVVLNVSAIDASGFESWLRRTGGNTIKKYLSDQRLEFKLEGGII